MSKGPGRVERAIAAAFERNPDGYFDVADLAGTIYPNPYWRDPPAPDRAQRGAIVRAAAKVAPRMHWVMLRSLQRGGEAIYCNGLSLRSYALGSLRRWLGDAGQYRWAMVGGKMQSGAWMTNAERLVDRLDTDPDVAKKIAPGGDWWLQVECNRAEASGDTLRAQELTTQIEQRTAAQMAQLRAMYAR